MILETVTVKEAAEVLGVNISALYQAARSDSEELRAVRCGNQLRLLKVDVENYKPRIYPRKDRLMQNADEHQRRIASLVEGLVARDEVSPPVRELLAASMPGRQVEPGGRVRYQFGFVSQDLQRPMLTLRADHDVSPFFVYEGDDDEAIIKKALAWATYLVEHGRR